MKTIYNDEQLAISHIIKEWWGGSVYCPFCESENVTETPVRSKAKNRHFLLGYFYCYDCKDKFTIRKGTRYEKNYVPLVKWMIAEREYNNDRNINPHKLSKLIKVHYLTSVKILKKLKEN